MKKLLLVCLFCLSCGAIGIKGPKGDPGSIKDAESCRVLWDIGQGRSYNVEYKIAMFSEGGSFVAIKSIYKDDNGEIYEYYNSQFYEDEQTQVADGWFRGEYLGNKKARIERIHMKGDVKDVPCD